MSLKFKHFFVIVLMTNHFLYCGLGKDASSKAPKKMVYFRTAETKFHPILMDHYKMNISPDGKSSNIYVGMRENVYEEPWILITVMLRTHESKNRNRNLHMFQYDLNCCNALSKLGTQVRGFVVSWIKTFWTSGKLPQKCPVSKGNYTWIGLSMEKLNIPQFLPNSEYAVNVFTYFRRNDSKEMLGNLDLLVEVK